MLSHSTHACCQGTLLVAVQGGSSGTAVRPLCSLLLLAHLMLASSGTTARPCHSTCASLAHACSLLLPSCRTTTASWLLCNTLLPSESLHQT